MKRILLLLTSLFSIMLLFALWHSFQNHPATKNDSSATTKVVATHLNKSTSTKSILQKLRNSPSKQIIYAPFGDSLSVGLFSDKKTFRFTSLFAENLQKRLGKPVIEKGTSQVGKMASNFGVEQVDTIIQQHPNLITVEFGTNDAAGGDSLKAINNFSSAMDLILKKLTTKTNAEIILLTTWSNNGGKHASTDKHFDDIIYQLGKKYQLPVADLSSIWDGNNDMTGPYGSYLKDFKNWGPRDNFHPNQLGHTKIAQLLNKQLNKSTNKDT